MSSGAAAAGDGIFRCVFEGCISCSDTGIERRPYHRNCGCALHKSRGSCAHANRSGGMHVSYPIRRSWSEGCMSLVAAGAAGSSGNSSPAEVVSPARVASMADNLCGRRNNGSGALLPLCREDEEDLDGGSIFFKV